MGKQFDASQSVMVQVECIIRALRLSLDVPRVRVGFKVSFSWKLSRLKHQSYLGARMLSQALPSRCGRNNLWIEFWIPMYD
jgi:hypothetical protein